MTTAQKAGIGVLIIAVIAMLGAYALQQDDTAQTSDTVLTTSPDDASDEALEKDAAAIDSEISGLEDDSATIDASISDSAQ
jgi:hypothetical protein